MDSIGNMSLKGRQMNRFNALRTWWLIAAKCKPIGQLLNIKLANKAVSSGYRYTPGDWIEIDEQVSICPHPEFSTRNKNHNERPE